MKTQRLMVLMMRKIEDHQGLDHHPAYLSTLPLSILSLLLLITLFNKCFFQTITLLLIPHSYLLMKVKKGENLIGFLMCFRQYLVLC